jgi:nonsense-mediated mRNA decay protein 3
VFVLGFEKFCVKCGKTTDALIHGMCTDCFLKRHELFEMKEINVERCVKCKKGRVKGHWEYLSNETIANEVSSKVKLNHNLDQPKIFVELTPQGETDFEANITVEGFLDGVLVSKKMRIFFSLDKVSCDACMKLCSNYREAIIQLRAGSQEEADAMLEVTKELLAQESAKDSLSASIKTLSMKRAYDLWIGSNKGASKVARKLSKLYKTEIICSKKLIGQEDSGKEKYRFTYCIKKE